MDISQLHPFELLDDLERIVREAGPRATIDGTTPLSERAQFYTHGNVTVQPFVTFDGPIFLGEGVHIGPYSMIRGPLYLGAGVHIGPYCEIARCYVGERSQITHKNIIPDSVIHANVWLSGGAIFCNTRMDMKPVRLHFGGEVRSRPAFGALAMSGCKIGVNVIAMPGTVITENTTVFGPSTIKGLVV